ncbi:formimidoylglutamase [Salinicoccus siamensis]|uniref:Formimidoylglutamase n=1 Tax=Salinicoccus siamensis TaxID=381830 RepID=A0ABV5Z5V6_9STAP
MKEIETHQYTGRVDDPDMKERIHQHMSGWTETVRGDAPVFIGFRSDEGVRRNKGRPGAHLGPVKVREKLASLPWTAPIYDYGSIVGDTDLEGSQAALGRAVYRVLHNKQFPLIIGGGHETLYGHYLGVRAAYPDKRIAVLNFDAHFDLRDERPSSGTMFHQILSADQAIDYYVVGIQPPGNTKSLFDAADRFGVKYAEMETVRKTTIFEEMLAELAEYDAVFATLCMDSVQQGVAPGTSAPSADGYTAAEIHDMVGKMAELTNLVSFDISEVSPPLDVDDRTSSLAASLFHSFMTKKESFQ